MSGEGVNLPTLLAWGYPRPSLRHEGTNSLFGTIFKLFIILYFGLQVQTPTDHSPQALFQYKPCLTTCNCPQLPLTLFATIFFSLKENTIAVGKGFTFAEHQRLRYLRLSLIWTFLFQSVCLQLFLDPPIFSIRNMHTLCGFPFFNLLSHHEVPSDVSLSTVLCDITHCISADSPWCYHRYSFWPPSLINTSHSK